MAGTAETSGSGGSLVPSVAGLSPKEGGRACELLADNHGPTAHRSSCFGAATVEYVPSSLDDESHSTPISPLLLSFFQAEVSPGTSQASLRALPPEMSPAPVFHDSR